MRLCMLVFMLTASPAIAQERLTIQVGAEDPVIFESGSMLRNAVEGIKWLAEFLVLNWEADERDEPDRPALGPEDFRYLGAVALPKAPWTGGQRPRWDYGGHALAYNPDNDSLVGSGHIRFPGLVSEFGVPVQIVAGPPVLFAPLGTRQEWRSVLRTDADRAHRLEHVLDRQGGITYLDGRLHWSFYRYYSVQPPATTDDATHGSSPVDFAAPGSSGFYHVGPLATAPFHQDSYGTYLLTFPAPFAAEHLGGRRIGTGRLGGAGPIDSPPTPSLFAYDPSHPEDAIAVSYRSPGDKPSTFHPTDRCFGADFIEWKGRRGIAAVVWKGLGRTWYGVADVEDLHDQCGGTWKGYRSERYEVQLQVFDPLMRLEPNVATLTELGECGRPGGCAFDSKRGYFYIFEMSSQPRIHVWKLGEA